MVPTPKIAWSAAATFWRMANISSWRRIIAAPSTPCSSANASSSGGFFILSSWRFMFLQSEVGDDARATAAGSGHCGNWRCVVLEWVPSITAGEAAPGTLGGGYIRAPMRSVKGLAGDHRAVFSAGARRDEHQLARLFHDATVPDAPRPEKALAGLTPPRCSPWSVKAAVHRRMNSASLPQCAFDRTQSAVRLSPSPVLALRSRIIALPISVIPTGAERSEALWR